MQVQRESQRSKCLLFKHHRRIVSFFVREHVEQIHVVREASVNC